LVKKKSGKLADSFKELSPRSDAMKTVTLLIAEAYAPLRSAMCDLVQQFRQLELVGEAGEAAEALRVVRETQPSLILLDVRMSGRNGFSLLEWTLRDYPQARVIALGADESAEYAAYALRHGAAGYVPKRVVGAELEEAINAVMSGETYVSPAITEAELLEYAQRI
jgi:DNA-binding NarL/FixJ family response regulator